VCYCISNTGYNFAIYVQRTHREKKGPVMVANHMIPSSPMPGSPAFRPRPPRPTACRWPFSFMSGLHGGECCLCCRGISRRSKGFSGEQTHIFETVQVLVSLATNFALVGFLLLHAHCSWVWSRCLGVDNGEGTIAIFV
jgi:hypothetical protein